MNNQFQVALSLRRTVKEFLSHGSCELLTIVLLLLKPGHITSLTSTFEPIFAIETLSLWKTNRRNLVGNLHAPRILKIIQQGVSTSRNGFLCQQL